MVNIIFIIWFKQSNPARQLMYVDDACFYYDELFSPGGRITGPISPFVLK